MAAERAALHFTPLATSAWIAELTGSDELSVEESSTAAAIQLVDRLLQSRSGALAPGSAAQLPAADRDQVLAVIYRRTYGDVIESTVHCTGCAGTFELSFSLSTLAKHALDHRIDCECVDHGRLRLPDGRMLRIPLGFEECAAIELGPKEAERALRSICADGQSSEDESAADIAIVEDAAPLLSLDLGARCPDCGHEQAASFDVQSFLLTALLSERVQVTREIHRLAAAYSWSLQDILSLCRADRRKFVSLIETEFARYRRS